MIALFPNDSGTIAVQDVVPAASPVNPRFVVHVTPATPDESAADPDTASAAALVRNVEDDGDVMRSEGAVLSRVSLLYWTVSPAAAVAPETDSTAIEMLFAPSASTMGCVSQFIVPVATPLPPSEFAHVTRLMPEAWDAVPRTTTVREVETKVPPAAGAVIRSAGAVSVTLSRTTATDLDARAPAESSASTAIRFVPATRGTSN